MSEFFVSEVRVGRLRPLGLKAVPSGIYKDPVTGPAVAAACGLEGDAQGDRRTHGGPDKAIHAYSAAHYPDWADDLPDLAPQLHPGASARISSSKARPRPTSASATAGGLAARFSR